MARACYFEFINRLAAWDHQVPEQELVKEFIDIILFLQKQNQELIILQLIDKSRQQGLTETERMDLQKMLQDRNIILTRHVPSSQSIIRTFCNIPLSLNKEVPIDRER